MKRAGACLILALVLLADAAVAAPARALTDFRNPPNAVTWQLDHTTKTINVLARLQIYPACDHCPLVVNQFLADKIKSIIEAFWNRPLHYHCYELHFSVDITFAQDRFGIDNDRIGIRIDNGPEEIRDWVHTEPHNSANWSSNDPADKVVPNNDSLSPTTWGEYAARDWSNTYAHEFGHVLGLSDQYHDIIGPDGKLTSVNNDGAPDDVMGAHALFAVDQSTIDRMVERNGIHEKDLKCACVNPSSPTAHLIFALGGFGLTAIAPEEICGYTGTVTMTFTNNVSGPGLDQKIEIDLSGNVTWAPDPTGGLHEIATDSKVYLPADGNMTWVENGSIQSGEVSCTMKGGGTYPIHDPEHYRFYSHLEVAVDSQSGVAHYYGIGLEPPETTLGDVKLTCTPSGVNFPPAQEDLAGAWLKTGTTEALDAGGETSGPDGHLTGSYTEDSSNQGTGIYTWTWDLQPY